VTTIASAVLLGVAVLLAGNLPWGVVLAPLNLRVFPAVPWAIAPMLLYLWVYWAFISGRAGPIDSAALRRERLRARPLAPSVWAAALITGLIGFAALLVLTSVMARLVTMPASAPIVTPTGMPAATAAALLVMSSVIAGVTEEAGFRGYMQGPIEQRYGIVAAILVNGVMFGLLHFPNHPGAVVVMLPYYIAVTAVYSGLTWATDSILPAVALHVGGNIWSLSRLWATGKAEWQRSAEAHALVWSDGVDAAFLSDLGLFAVGAIVTLVSCRSLRLRARPSEMPAP
jgi:membrane protease YdiL (CAAX protease family)